MTNSQWAASVAHWPLCEVVIMERKEKEYRSSLGRQECVRCVKHGCFLRGFTLIELLVVIGIISILATILLPSLSKARKLAQQVKCVSNLRGLSIGFSLYLQDNSDYYPMSWDLLDGNPNSNSWVPRTWTYTTDENEWGAAPTSYYRNFTESLYRCPSNDLSASPFISYVMNLNLGYRNSAGSVSRRAQDIPYPGKTLMLSDGGVFLVTYQGLLQSVNDHLRHENNANVLFCDGSIDQREWIVVNDVITW